MASFNCCRHPFFSGECHSQCCVSLGVLRFGELVQKCSSYVYGMVSRFRTGGWVPTKFIPSSGPHAATE